MTAAESASTTSPEHPLESSQVANPHGSMPWLLVALCILVPALPSFVVPAGPLKSNGSPAKVVAIIFFALTILGFLAVRRRAPFRTIQPGVVIVLLYFFTQLLIYAIGLLNPSTVLVEASRTRVLIIVVSYTGVALYTAVRVRTMRQRSVVLGALAVGMTFACIVGLLQDTIDLRYLLQPPGFVVNSENTELAERLGSKRVMGTSSHAIEFSVIAAVSVVLNLHFARYALKRQTRLFAALAFVLALLAVPAAVSRSGLVALAFAFLVYVWSFKIYQILLAVGAAITAVLAYVSIFPVRAASLWDTVINSDKDPSVITRTVDYATVGNTFRAHPIFGLGLGGDPPAEYGFLDNEWLQALVQGGAVGFTAMLLLVAGGFFGFNAALRSATNKRERGLAYAMGAAYAAVTSTSVTFDLFGFQQAAMLFFLLFGLMWSTFKPRVTDLDGFLLPRMPPHS